MKQAPHIFDRFVFELRVPARERVNAVQNRVSTVASGRLYGVLADCLREMFDDRDFLVEKLELDLGKVSLENLEEDLMAGISRSLREWALRRSKWGSNSAQSAFQPPIARPQIALPQIDEPRTAPFFPGDSVSSDRPGDLWRVENQGSVRGGLNAAVASALQGGGDWRQFRAAIRENRALRARLTSEVSPELLRGLMRRMLPEEGARIADLSAALLSLDERGTLAGINDPNTFQRMVWECILEQVARHPATATGRLNNLAVDILRSLAARCSWSESALLAEIARLAKSPGQTNRKLIRLMRQLAEAGIGAVPFDDSGANHSAEGIPAPGNETTDALSWHRDKDRRPSRLENLAKFLEWGVIPRVMARRGEDSVENEILGLISTSPDEVARLIRRTGNQPAIRKRLASQFSEAAYHRVLGVVDPVHASWMTACERQLRRLHAQKPLVGLTGLTNRAFAQTWAEISLAYLAEHHWQSFDTQSFLRYLLQRLAQNQKTSYEDLLGDVALRRPARPYSGSGVTDMRAAAIDDAILHLLDHDLLAVDEPLPVVSGDANALLYAGEKSWPWQIVPQARTSEQGPDLTQPASSGRGSPTDAPRASHLVGFGIEALEIWLLHGTWPTGVCVHDREALLKWLEEQSDDTWMQSLRHVGARDCAVRRIVANLPFAFLLRVARLLAGSSANLACKHLISLLAAGRQLDPTGAFHWEGHLKRYALIHLSRAAANPGKPTFSSEELVRYTMRALSFRCQIPYERLLQAVQSESTEHAALRDLCSRLQEELVRASVEQSWRSSESKDEENPAARQEVILHYLRHGSLPEHASDIRMQGLRRETDLLSEDQITVIAGAALPWIARGEAAARRVASLFSTHAFARFARCVLPSFQFVAEIEAALPALARQLSLPEEELLVLTRSFLLHRAARHESDSNGYANAGKQVIAGLVIDLARCAGVAPAVVLNVLTSTSSHRADFVETVRELQARGIAMRQEVHSPTLVDQDVASNAPRGAVDHLFTTGRLEGASSAERNTGQEDEEASAASAQELKQLNFDHDALDGQLQAFFHWLKTGNLPWWADWLVRQSSGRWISELLAGGPDPLLQGLKIVSSNPMAVERLLRYLPQRYLEQIIHAAVPEYGGFVILFIQAGSELSKDEGLGQPQRSRSETVHWREALHFVLDTDLSKTSPAEFLRNLSRRVPQQLAIKSAPYLDAMLQVARQQAPKESGCRALEDLLLQIKSGTGSTPDGERDLDMAAYRAASAPVEAATPDSRPRSELSDRDESASILSPMHARASSRQESEFARGDSLLRDDSVFPDDSEVFGQVEHLLRYGELPSTVAEKSVAKFLDASAEQAHSRNLEYRACLRKCVPGEIERKRMAATFPARLLSQAWRLLLPKDHALAVVCLDLLESAATSGLNRSQQEKARQICIAELLRTAARPPDRRWDAAEYLRLTASLVTENLCLSWGAVAQRMRASLPSLPQQMQSKLGQALDRVERELSIVPLPTKSSSKLGSPKSRSNLPASFPPQSNPFPPILAQSKTLLSSAPMGNVLPPNAASAHVLSTHASPAREVPRRIPPTRSYPLQFPRSLPAGEPFYIHNAGAIILWPFLSRYFRTLDLLIEKDQFRSELETNRGIYLVQYLVTGQTEPPEPELLLNKILCGSLPEQPVQPILPVTETEARLSLQLLEGVIENWRKLGRTSVEGLRQSFLIREGRLSKKEDESWSLVVSTKGYDVLLDSIPWRLSLIRLPWMRAVLHVRWR